MSDNNVENVYRLWPSDSVSGSLYPTEMHAYAHQETCPSMFPTALLVDAPNKNNSTVELEAGPHHALQQENEWTTPPYDSMDKS